MHRLSLLLIFALIAGTFSYPNYIGDCISTGNANGNYHSATGMTGNGGITLTGLPAQVNSSNALSFTLTGSVKGYNIYASDLTGKVVGTWVIVDTTNTAISTLPCAGSTLSHTNSQTKTTVSLKWQPPTPPVTVTFKGTTCTGSGSLWYNISPVTVIAAVAAPAGSTGTTCTPYTSCALSNVQCGTLFDGCNTLTCGTCISPANCTAGQCVVPGCTPKYTCAGQGYQCGSFNNSCTIVSCGTCATSLNCDPMSLQCLAAATPIAPTPPAVAPVDANQLPSWVGVAVGVGAGVLVWILVFVAVIVFLVTRQKKQQRRASMAVANPEVVADPSTHYAPPMWRRTMKRLTQAFGYTSPVAQQEMQTQQGRTNLVPPVPPPRRR